MLRFAFIRIKILTFAKNVNDFLINTLDGVSIERHTAI